MEWTVKVKTQTGQIKDVYVQGYNYQQDAEAAALAQTGAVEILAITNTTMATSDDENYPNLDSVTSYSRCIYSGRKIPGHELEFLAYILFGIGFLAVFPPFGILILMWMSYRAISIYYKNL